MYRLSIYDSHNNLIKSLTVSSPMDTLIREAIIFTTTSAGIRYGFKDWGRYDLQEMED